MFSVKVPEGHHSFAAERLPEPSIGMCRTCYLVHGSSHLHPPSWLSQFLELHSHLSKPLHALLVRFGDCVHHPAGFVIFAQLALLSLFFILILPIHPIVGTCNISQTVSDSNQHRLNSLFWLYGCQSHDFSIRHIVLLLLNRCQCVFNSLSRRSGFSLNIILNQFLFLFIA